MFLESESDKASFYSLLEQKFGSNFSLSKKEAMWKARRYIIFGIPIVMAQKLLLLIQLNFIAELIGKFGKWYGQKYIHYKFAGILTPEEMQIFWEQDLNIFE